MSKNKINTILTFGLLAGGIILELGIIKKLDDIHKEIIYFEECKGVWIDRKTYEKRQDDYWKEKLGEA